MKQICSCAHHNGKYFAIAVIIVILVLCCCTQTDCYTAHRKQKRDIVEVTNDDSLFITISSTQKLHIELNWNFSKVVPTQIRLYNTEPKEGSHPIAWIDNHHRKGFYVTKQTLNYDVLPNGWDREKNFDTNFKPDKGPHCLNYWIAAFKNNRMLKASCLQIQPTWMKDNGNKIGNIPMGKLMIPGTHNSGCYDEFPEADIRLRFLDNYLYTQDQDVWTQLCFGIRYLDVRVGYYNSSNTTFWVNHDQFQVTQLKDMLRVIKLFVRKAEDEIVIVDFHRFPVGFKNRERHRQLLELLHVEIGDMAIPRSYQKTPHGPTLNDLWKQKRRVIIAYGDKTSAINSDYLWDPLSQQWGNKQSTSSLKSFLEDIRFNRKLNTNNPLWAAMAELTPTTAAMILGALYSNGSLTKMADSVNRNLTAWYKYDWCDTNNNVIATDFFLGNDIINVCMYCNIKMAKNWN